jgi:hypothetical protein
MKTLLALATLLTLAPFAAAVDRYVAPTGKDTNAGTLSAPWKTVQKAANSAKAGDTVHIREGSYTEKVQINVSGTSSARITFRNYTGEKPVLDLTGVTPGADLSAIIRIPSRSFVTVQGLELKNFRTADESRVPCGILVDGASAGVQLIGNTIRYIEQNNTVKSNWDANAHGIAVYGTTSTSISDLIIDGNEVANLRLGASEAIVVNGNVNGFKVTNNKVHDCNNIGIDVIGYEGTCRTASLDRARNGVVCNNTVYNIDSSTNPAYSGDFTKGGGYRAAAGIYVDGGTATVIERNHVYNCNFGVELASEHKTGKTDLITVRNNLLRHNHGAGVIMGGYDEQRGVTENCEVSNNTLYLNDSKTTWSGQIQFQFYVRNNIFKNNILWGNSKTKQMVVHYPGSDSATSSQKEFGAGNVFSYNLYFCAGAASSNVAFEIFTGGKFRSYTGVAAWQTSGKVSGDAGSSFANPKFATANPTATAAASAFKLLTGSPAINTGKPSVVPVLSEMDLFNEVRIKSGRMDRGADEF